MFLENVDVCFGSKSDQIYILNNSNNLNSVTHNMSKCKICFTTCVSKELMKARNIRENQGTIQTQYSVEYELYEYGCSSALDH